MMDGYDMGAGGWATMMTGWLIVTALIVWIVARLSGARGQDRPAPDETPRDILDRRLARGEIDGDAHARLKATIEDRR